MDPVTIVLASAAAGGAAGKAAEKAIDYLHDLLRGQSSATQEAAARNALAMVIELQNRLVNLEEATANAALRSPDVAATFQMGVTGAARTEDVSKHQLLARAVAERMVARDESIHALACNRAVEVLPRLTVAQLTYLAIGSLVYAVRPGELPLSDAADLDREGRVTEAEAEAIRGYMPWLRDMLVKLDLTCDIGEVDEAHLISNGCIVRETRVRRDLAKALTPFGRRIVTIASSDHLTYKLAEFLYQDPLGHDLRSLWENHMEHVIPTPTGLLIGATFLELRTGTPVDVQRAMATPAAPDMAIDDRVWDGRNIREEFLRVLDRAVEDRAERGVGPWYDFEKNSRR